MSCEGCRSRRFIAIPIGWQFRPRGERCLYQKRNDGDAIGGTQTEYDKSAGLELEIMILDDSEWYESVNDTAIHSGVESALVPPLSETSGLMSILGSRSV